ncbi:N-acetyltransferase family protein [Sodalis sp. C49]|uniref:GNAT family N-acetyltransferase n=1 Tax=unclassified Sodalis (in: enterobacteria) TaxID=2636512 RepID=UPI003965BCEA
MKKEDVVVRDYREADRPFLRTLYLSARKAGWTWLDNRQWRLEDFDGATFDEKIIVAEIQGHIAGFASLWLPDSFLHNLFVDPAWQRRGVATALLTACYPLCRGTMALKCLQENVGAQQFYLRHGWTIISSGVSEHGKYYLMHRRIRQQ